jgi:hypothetical protein
VVRIAAAATRDRRSGVGLALDLAQERLFARAQRAALEPLELVARQPAQARYRGKGRWLDGGTTELARRRAAWTRIGAG